MAAKRLYLGNIPYDVTETDLRAFLAPRQVVEIKIVVDRDTQRPRGFAFAEMADEAAALDAITELHDTALGGRNIIVSIANDRKSSGSGGGDRGRRDRGRDDDRGGRRGRRDQREDY